MENEIDLLQQELKKILKLIPSLFHQERTLQFLVK